MSRLLCTIVAAFALCLATAYPLSAQSDALLNWVPSTGESSFGPYTSASGYMNMWQDGNCVNGRLVGASVVEEWLCSTGQTATVSGQAGLLFRYDECLGSYPIGVWASGSVSVQSTPVNQEWGDSDCTGFSDSSGGPHPWPCGEGSGFID